MDANNTDVYPVSGTLDFPPGQGERDIEIISLNDGVKMFFSFKSNEKVCKMHIEQWRIQDFPQGGAPTPKIALHCKMHIENMFLSQIPEVDETIQIALRNPSAESRIGQDSVTYLTILKNNDAIHFAGFIDNFNIYNTSVINN